MPYCTFDDIKKLLPEETVIQLTDDEGLGVVNAERVEEAIDSADAEIDGHIGGRYSVPLATVTALAKKLSVDIALYNLYSRTVGEMPELRRDRYKEAIRFLEAVSRGTASLGVDPEPSAPSDVGAETNKTTEDRVFTRGSLEGF